MKVYTYSKARQNLAKLLDEVTREGEAQIKRRDGSTFMIKPVNKRKSPLDIKGVDSGLKLNDINKAVRESRARA